MAGRMKQVRPVGDKSRLNVCAQAKCDYCGLFGALGRCDGCGAANAPVRPSIEVTASGSREREFVSRVGGAFVSRAFIPEGFAMLEIVLIVFVAVLVVVVKVLEIRGGGPGHFEGW